jgi:hypothetical protein
MGHPGELTGPVRLKSYRYTVADIVKALMSIGRGATYRQAAIQASGGGTMNGQLVANWVKVFGPVVAAHGASRGWPLLLRAGGFPLPSGFGGRGLTIQVAVGLIPGQGGAEVWQAQAVLADTYAEWRRFFAARPGTPKVLIVERDSEAATAALHHWAAAPPTLLDPPARRTPELTAVSATYAACRNALFRRLAARQAHFNDRDQLDQLLGLMRLDLNGHADPARLAELILSGERSGARDRLEVGRRDGGVGPTQRC